MAPSDDEWDHAVESWLRLRTDPDAVFDRSVVIDAGMVQPMVTWGTTPAHSVPVSGRIPEPGDGSAGDADRRALTYMGLEPEQAIAEVAIDRVFIGSCTNGRLEDLRSAAAILRGRRLAEGVTGLVVPGSTAVRAAAEAEGLDRVFKDAGLEWREAGCSMCLGMNPDVLQSGERCASTSNRNFEGRQGRGGRTHLVSPAMAAAAAVTGRFTDPRSLMEDE